VNKREVGKKGVVVFDRVTPAVEGGVKTWPKEDCQWGTSFWKKTSTPGPKRGKRAKWGVKKAMGERFFRLMKEVQNSRGLGLLEKKT